MEATNIRYLKVREAARITGLKVDSIRYQIKVGNIEYKRLPSGAIRVYVDQNANLVYKEVVNG